MVHTNLKTRNIPFDYNEIMKALRKSEEDLKNKSKSRNFVGLEKEELKEKTLDEIYGPKPTREEFVNLHFRLT